MTDLAQQLEMLVGAAVRGLIEAGASDEAIGRFAHLHRARVSEILGLGQGTEASTPDDLLALVKQAVSEVLAQQGQPRRPAGERKSRIPVLVAGRRTSVSVAPGLLRKLVDNQGSRRAAIKIVQQLAASPSDGSGNRSGAVEVGIENFLKLASAHLNATEARH